MINRIKSYFEKGDERTKNIKVNVLQSFIYKGLSIVLSLLIVPFTIGFVNAEQYGIWLTISSIVGWVGYFDLGLGHGLRNKYTEAKARGDHLLMSELVSTTYVLIAIIFVIVFIAFLVANQFINWNSFLGGLTDLQYKSSENNDYVAWFLVLKYGSRCFEVIIIRRSAYINDITLRGIRTIVFFSLDLHTNKNC
ncbi:hypothetical protein NXW98_14955 [Bacteroides caccae]|nr:hypothetical protein [Bacteroides caccae]MCS3192434.1 hypothetical protein [Bacteroides caccae]